ncbi:MAG: hypothetical protein JW791_03455, partial [Nanoarchaeota archaeon]|nr:hypothetical protein [Nanoarchaeota archaeon]
MRAQISFEVLSIVIVVIIALAITTVLVDINAREQKALTEAQALVKTISVAVEIVNLLGEGSYKEVYVYVPSLVNSSRTFANNATLNYGIELTSGTTDIFGYYGECVAGDLPTLPGYYKILVYHESGCTYLDYNLSTDFPTVDCWGINGECDEACLYSNFGNTSYYLDPGCSSTCLFAGEFYAPTISCDEGGNGSCYKFSNPNVRYTACTKGSSCAGACFGTPTPCSLLTLGNCSSCGCTISSASTGTDVWVEDFSASTDWATFSAQGNGIAYVNDAV